jgi:hypothetical protein
VIFSRDGTMTVMESTGELGIGAWEKVSDHHYAFTFWEFYQQDGASVQVKISSPIELSRDGNQYSAPFSFQMVDLQGNVLAEGRGTAIGVRMQVE